ncbi:MAG: sarcosine oxidase subunit gamma family protein [Paracoccaceae bacterium]|nr:sarcosine oxidase subunit gamma family protein [Paracoccaceae bacterium]
MVDLTAKSACEGLLPISVGSVTLSEIVPENLISVAAYKGQSKALSTALDAARGIKMPAPNRHTGSAKLRAIWTGPDQAMLVGQTVGDDLVPYASVVDLSDAWAIVKLEGKSATAVLARLTPIDLRPSHFKRGHTAKTDLMHMMASITKTGVDSFEIMVFRSMAKTLVHDLTTAMETLAARDIA